MSNQPRKTSNIVKRVDDVEETIPDYYGPQDEEPSGEFKKGDMWFVDDAVESVENPEVNKLVRKVKRVKQSSGQTETPKRTRPLREIKHVRKTYKLHKKGR